MASPDSRGNSRMDMYENPWGEEFSELHDMIGESGMETLEKRRRDTIVREQHRKNLVKLKEKSNSISKADPNQDNWVERLLNPEEMFKRDIQYPREPDTGKVNTHLLAQSEATVTYDGSKVTIGEVYPLVVDSSTLAKNKGKNIPAGRHFVRLSKDEAYKHASEKNLILEFNTPEEALWFTERYKNMPGIKDKWERAVGKAPAPDRYSDASKNLLSRMGTYLYADTTSPTYLEE